MRATKIRTVIAATAMSMVLPMAAPVMAQAELSVPLTLPAEGEVSVISANYSCAGAAPVTVQYVNAGVNSLALLTIDGEMRVFVNVVAASGARYVAADFEWWVRGDSAMFTRGMDGGAPLECRTGDAPTPPAN